MATTPPPARRDQSEQPGTPPQPQRVDGARGQGAPAPAERAPSRVRGARTAAAGAAGVTAAAAGAAGKKALGGAASAAATVADPNATAGEKAQAAAAAGAAAAATAIGSAVATPVAGKVAGTVVGAAANSKTGRRVAGFLAGGVALAIVSIAVGFALFLSQVAGALVQEDEDSRRLGDSDQCGGTAVVVDQVNPGLLTDEQWGNATAIVRVGQERGLPDYAYVVAIATAMQESSLRNIDYGDRDSVGLFQQRPSQGWGTVQQIMDPAYSSGKFYDVLVTVDGWESMPLTVAAQRVQRSGFPDAYAKHETLARQVVASITGGAAVGGCDGAVYECVPLVPSTVENGLTPDALNYARCAAAQFSIPTGNILGVGNRAANPKSDHPAGRAVDLMVADWRTTSATGDEWAQWTIDNADAFGVNYVIWDARIWTKSSGEWRDYRHPSGATDPTNMHLDHLHVSVFGNAGTGFGPGGGGTGIVVGGWAFPLNPGAPITSNYGMRIHPVTGERKMHAGTDFAARTGDPVYAAAGGTVTRASNWGTGGQTIFVDHGNGVVTHYLHLSAYHVGVGQQVTAGQQIGLAGATGRVTGPHLHFEIAINGNTVDPVPYLKARGVM